MSFFTFRHRGNITARGRGRHKCRGTSGAYKGATAPPPAYPEPLERRVLMAVSAVSVVTGTATPGNALSAEPSVSDNGRFVAFRSDASNLVAGDTNNASDVFVFDRSLGTTTLISVNSAGTGPGNGASGQPSISADGAFVSFRSSASDLVAGDANSAADVFIREWRALTPQTVRLSVDGAGGDPDDGSSEPFASEDGQFVAFTSRAGDLTAPGQDRGDLRASDVFLRDRALDTTALVSLTAGGVSGNAASSQGSVSDDGRFVAFLSDASDLAAGDSNGLRDVFVRDMVTGATTLISVGPGGVLANGASDGPMISGDGDFVVFTSAASNLTGNDANGQSDVFVRDLVNNTTTLISINQTRTAAGNGASFSPSIGRRGDEVAFISSASDLVVGDGNNSADVFLFDRDSGTMNLLSVNLSGAPAGGDAFDAAVGQGGDDVAFTSAAGNMVAADGNGFHDVYRATAPDRGSDNTAPIASVIQMDQPPAVAGAPALEFTVTYADQAELAPGEFGSDDVVVNGPNGFTQIGTFVSSIGSGKLAKATYRVTAPGGSLDSADNGDYTVSVQLEAVEDAAGNFLPAGAVGSFQLQVGTSDGPDLVPSAPELRPRNRHPLPALVAGSEGRARVFVANAGNQTAAGSLDVGLYLSEDTLLDASDTLLVTRNIPRFKRGAGKRMPVTLKFIYPALSPGGATHLLAWADLNNAVAEARESNNFAHQPLTVAAPFADLSGSIGSLRATPVPGKRVRVPLMVQNNGNAAVGGSVTYTVLASADALPDGGDTPVVARTKRLSLKPGRARLVPLRVTVPSLPAGSYTFLVQIDSANAVGESAEGNNLAVLDMPFTVA